MKIPWLRTPTPGNRHARACAPLASTRAHRRRNRSRLSVLPGEDEGEVEIQPDVEGRLLQATGAGGRTSTRPLRRCVCVTTHGRGEVRNMPGDVANCRTAEAQRAHGLRARLWEDRGSAPGGRVGARLGHETHYPGRGGAARCNSLWYLHPTASSRPPHGLRDTS